MFPGNEPVKTKLRIWGTVGTSFQGRDGRGWRGRGKSPLIVIPSDARDLLFCATKEKADPSGKTGLRDDTLRVFSQPRKP
jgi:hypothetical protein